MKNNEEYYTRAIYASLRIAFIALLLIWSFEIIKPFLLPVLWGIIISVAMYPVFKKLAKLMGGREKLAAVIITLAGVLIIVVPSYFLIDSAVEGVQDFANDMEKGVVKVMPPPSDVMSWPVIGKAVYETWDLFSSNLESAIIKFTPQIKEYAPKVFSLATGFGSSLLLFIISIIIAGALFPQAKASEKAAKSIFKTLVGDKGEEFTELTTKTIKSVVQGVIGVAAIQSLLGGIGIWAVGIPAAGIWAILILLFAIMQLPPLIILGPLAVYVFTITDTTSAVIFLIWSIIVSMSDAFLKPIFLGRGVDVPMLAVLLGAIGGMIMAGIIGLFVGAVVLAITYKVFQAILVDDFLDK